MAFVNASRLLESNCLQSIYHPRGYVKPEDGGAMVEYDTIVNHVTMWNVAVERQIQVKGQMKKLVDYVIIRDATKFHL